MTDDRLCYSSSARGYYSLFDVEFFALVRSLLHEASHYKDMHGHSQCSAIDRVVANLTTLL